MKLTLFAVRHGDKVYEFREPIEVDIYPNFGYGKALVCPRIGFMWNGSTYIQLFTHLAIQIDAVYRFKYHKRTSELISKVRGIA